MNVLLLLVGLALVLVGAGLLTDGAAALAQRFRVPEFIVGLTVVAVGTSAPELVVSLLSAIGGQSNVAVGNVVGSNLFNTFVILGVCALVRPLVLSRSNIRRDIPFGFVVSVLFFLFASDRLLHLGAADRIDRVDGIVMLALYAGSMWFSVKTAGRSGAPAQADKPAKALWLTFVLIVVGLAGLVGGGELFLHHATLIARRLG
ncbi:MAG: sodium:calcium antiporter, partial [Alistipes sp.]|nr:sodium:calcium antiporter [Alistipes sp.]